ncbi:protein TIFY 6a-like [Phragmites australis]|uniref:protein TIFY 6a-like n=1 Tax=Phragmites australis TaxID=29695 RepID=UPI002D78E4EE|nr:protein TIFY 6a-like [Phragmites australis]
MERDFLGAIGRKEKDGEAVDGESRTEPDYTGGAPAMQWQFPAKSGAAPTVMSFRTAKENNRKEFSISGFRQAVATAAAAGDAFDGIKMRASLPVMPQQRQFGLDTRVTAQQYAAVAHRQHIISGGSRMVQPLSSRHPAPFDPVNPALGMLSLHNAAGSSFKNQPFTASNAVNGSTVGMYGVRNQKSTQLTIFYGGSVNVFDNAPAEKVQELMLLASRASIPSPPSAACKPNSPVSAPAKVNVPEVLPARQIVIQKPEPSVPHLSSISSPVPVVSQAVTLPMSTSSCNPESTGPKTPGLPSVVTPISQSSPSVVTPISQASSSQPTPVATTTAASIMPRAVPQARKASLARFLEKRKERVATVAPYPASKSPLESSDALGSASAPSKSSSTDIAQTSNNDEEPLCYGQPRNISFSSEACLSTRLQI